MKIWELRKWSAAQKMSASFLVVILIGSILLSLPIMHKDTAPVTTYLDHFFTAVSMVCVTGLTVISVGDTYNKIGQLVGIILMQIGGLGLVTILSVSAYALKQKLSLKEANVLQVALNRHTKRDVKQYLFTAYRFTFAVETIAALVLSIDFIPRYGVVDGIFNAVFIAVSAFCNAGFDNLGTTSLQQFATHPLINFTVIFLIIAGGIGFGVVSELRDWIGKLRSSKPIRIRYHWRRLSLHTRLVLYTSVIMWGTGTIVTWVSEMNNIATIGAYSLGEQGMISLFQTVAFRTAGFSTIDYSLTTPFTNLVYMLQMIIGGAPGGTAGGIKVTTAAILCLLFVSEIKGHSHVTFAKRVIHSRVVKLALTITLFYCIILFIGFAALLWTNPHLDSFSLLFESISAIATVGSSMNVTGQLNTMGEWIIIVLMFLGRVGPVTVIVSIMQRKQKEIHYATADIIVG